MAKTDKDADKKSMDVSKPGKSMPDLSARPVIVTHRPMVQDPMVKTNIKVEEPSGPSDPEPSASEFKEPDQPYEKKVIKPINNPEPSEPQETKTENTKESEPVAQKPSSEEAAVVEAVASQAKSGKKDGEPSEQDKANKEHIKKLIADKTYFVSVGQVTRRRNRRAVVALAVFVLIALSGAYAAVDAGIIAANIELPIDLIKN